MFRKIQEKDKAFYINTANEFYDSNAVDHKVPCRNIENTFNELMRSNEYAECYIFEKDGEKAGYALLAKTFSQEAGGLVLWIEEIYIREPYRSKGLGREFFNYIEKEKDGDTVRIRLEVEEKNERAQSLYRQLGYEVLDYVQMIKDF